MCKVPHSSISCFWVVSYIDLQMFFIAVLINGGYGSSLPRSETTRISAEIYIPSTGRSCILPSLPVLGYIFSIVDMFNKVDKRAYRDLGDSSE